MKAQHPSPSSPACAPSRKLLELSLPSIPGAAPDGVHSIVRDSQGNIYASDEFNNSILSWTPGGSLRWQRTDPGREPGQLQRPCGIAFGRVGTRGSLRPALGVCDAWNNRLQFLDESGQHLCVWDAACQDRPGDFRDLRFFPAGSDGGAGCWLVLDRSNHRIRAFDVEGNPLFEIGQGFPAQLESRWAKRTLAPAWDNLPPGLVHDFPVFDPLYYPTRFLGQVETELYVTQPLAGQLKQILFGCVFPLRLKPPGDGEWIAAENGRFLSWDPGRDCLTWQDSEGRAVFEEQVEGRPVAAGAALSDVWLQVDGGLVLRQLGPAGAAFGDEGSAPPFGPLLSSALAEVTGAAGDRPWAPFEELRAPLKAFLDICDELLARADQEGPDCETAASLQDRIVAAADALGGPGYFRSEAFHRLWLSMLAQRLIAQSGSCFGGAEPSLDSATRCAAEAVRETVRRFDRGVFLRLRITRSKSPSDVALSMLEQLDRTLVRVIHELRLWSGWEFDTTRVLAIPTVGPAGAVQESVPAAAGDWLRRPVRSSVGSRSRQLQEIGRIVVPAADPAEQLNAAGVVELHDGRLAVSFYRPGIVVCLRPDGTFEREVPGPDPSCRGFAGPGGIAVDGAGRLWVPEYDGDGLCVWDPGTGATVRIPVGRTGGERPDCPTGVARGARGSMLVADSRNHRILSADDSGKCEAFCGGPGEVPGKLSRPSGIWTGTLDGAAVHWVVDQRNHRLQAFDVGGQLLRVLGSCGPGRGCFIVPEHVSQFADGLLAVTQNRPEKSIKLFSPGGEETDRLYVDYRPTGLVAVRDRLIVAEWEGGAVRIYERTR